MDICGKLKIRSHKCGFITEGFFWCCGAPIDIMGFIGMILLLIGVIQIGAGSYFMLILPIFDIASNIWTGIVTGSIGAVLMYFGSTNQTRRRGYTNLFISLVALLINVTNLVIILVGERGVFLSEDDVIRIDHEHKNTQFSVAIWSTSSLSASVILITFLIAQYIFCIQLKLGMYSVNKRNASMCPKVQHSDRFYPPSRISTMKVNKSSVRSQSPLSLQLEPSTLHDSKLDKYCPAPVYETVTITNSKAHESKINDSEKFQSFRSKKRSLTCSKFVYDNLAFRTSQHRIPPVSPCGVTYRKQIKTNPSKNLKRPAIAPPPPPVSNALHRSLSSLSVTITPNMSSSNTPPVNKTSNASTLFYNATNTTPPPASNTPNATGICPLRVTNTPDATPPLRVTNTPDTTLPVQVTDKPDATSLRVTNTSQRSPSPVVANTPRGSPSPGIADTAQEFPPPPHVIDTATTSPPRQIYNTSNASPILNLQVAIEPEVSRIVTEEENVPTIDPVTDESIASSYPPLINTSVDPHSSTVSNTPDSFKSPPPPDNKTTLNAFHHPSVSDRPSASPLVTNSPNELMKSQILRESCTTSSFESQPQSITNTASLSLVPPVTTAVAEPLSLPVTQIEDITQL